MMKIIQVHNYYQQPGGEDGVVAAELSLLRKEPVESSSNEISRHVMKSATARHTEHTTATALSARVVDIAAPSSTFPLHFTKSPEPRFKSEAKYQSATYIATSRR